MISDSRLEKALTFLAQSDQEAAELLTNVSRMEYKAKAVKEAVFLHSDGKTVREREAKAEASDEYQKGVQDYLEALEASNAVRNKRRTEELVVDVWRTLQANRRQGS